MAAKLFTALNANSFQINSVANGTSNGDAVNLGQMNSAISTAISNAHLSGKVVVDSTYSTLAAWITGVNYSGNVSTYPQETILILTQGTAGSSRYVQNGGTAGTSADWTNLDTVMSSATIYGMFSGSNGINFNGSTGAITLANSYTAQIGDGTNTSFSVSNQGGANAAVGSVLVYETSTGVTGDAQVTIGASGAFTIAFTTAPSLNQYTYVVTYVY